MLTLNKNCEKINDYLSSFFADTAKFHPDKKKSNHEDVNSPARDYKSPRGSLGSLSSPKDTSLTEKRTLPRNEENFKSRLSTFDFGQWSSIELSPLVFASYGWYLKKRDMLQCVTCKAFLCSALPPFNEQDAYFKFLAILKKRIITGHKDWCGWPYNPCNPEFMHPPLSISAHYVAKLKVDAMKLCSLGDNLPYFDHAKILGKLDLEERNISILYGVEDMSKIQVTAALLILCGWVFDSSLNLRCDICLRRINFSNFLSLEKENEFLKLKQRYLEKMEKLKVKEEKRKKKEIAQKALEAKQRKEFEAQEETKALELMRQVEAKKVREAIDKISQLENEEFEKMDTNLDDIEEEEENSLLSEIADEESNTLEDLRVKGVSDEYSTQLVSDDSKKIPEVSCENEGEKEDDVKSQTSVEEDTDISTHQVNVNDFDSVPDQPVGHSSDSSDNSSPNSSPRSGIDHSRKRPRESESSPSLPDFSDEEDSGSKASKIMKLSEEIEESSEKETSSSVPEEGTSEGKVSPESSSSMASPAEENEASNSSQSVGSDDVIEAEEEEDILFKRMEESLFEPLEQHRHWCGWVTDTNLLSLEKVESLSLEEGESLSLEEGESLSLEEGERRNPLLGFRILPPQLKEFASDISSSNWASSQKSASNVEGLRAVRMILESWEVEKSMEEVEEEE